MAAGKRCLRGAPPRPSVAPPPHGMAPPQSPWSLERARLARSFKAACGKRRACFAPSDAAEVEASPLRRRRDCWEGRRDGGGGTRSRLPVRVKRGGSRNPSRSPAGAGGAGLRGPIRPGEGRGRRGRGLWESVAGLLGGGAVLRGRGREFGLSRGGVLRALRGPMGRGHCGRGPGWGDEVAAEVSSSFRGRVSPWSACPGGGALWLGLPVGEGAAGVVGAGSPRGTGVSRTGVSLHDPRRPVLRCSLSWLREPPG